MLQIKRTYKTVIRRGHDYTQAFAQVFRNSPRRALYSIFKIIKCRLKYGLGPLHYSLYGLEHVPAEQWSTYAGDSHAFLGKLSSSTPKELRAISENKIKFYLHCKKCDLPTIPVIGYMSISDECGPTELFRIKKEKDLLHVFADVPDALFIKPAEGFGGTGAIIIHGAEEGWSTPLGAEKRKNLFNSLERNLKKTSGWIIQPRLRPDDCLLPIMSRNGLGTIRAVTCISEGSPKLLWSQIKLTTGTNFTDNFSKGLSGNLVAMVNTRTGTIGKAYGSLDRRWPQIAEFSRHPDTGNAIEGFNLPFWNEFKQLVLRAQSSVPFLKTVAWDIASTNSGLVIVESNCRYGLSSLQVAHQRGLACEMEDIIGNN